MKYFINLFFVLIFAVIVPGCYTIVWTPDEDLPSERYYEYQSYYPDNYYGDYYYFYDYPWWLTITSPDHTRADNSSIERNTETTRSRNTDGGRSIDRRNPDNGNNNGNIIQTSTPTRDRSSDNNSKSSGSTSTSSSNDNSSSSPRTETERSRGSDNNSGSGSSRNNDGGRSTGGRR